MVLKKGKSAVRLILPLAVALLVLLTMSSGWGFEVSPDGKPRLVSNAVLAAGTSEFDWEFPIHASSGSWLGTWENRLKIRIDHSSIMANLTNFPVLVHLSTSSGKTSIDTSAVFDELTSDANRKKIAVTTSDETTQCYVEIKQWSDADEQAWLWVKVPSVSATVDTVLYLYYDVAQADNTTYVGDTNSTPAETVWDSNFMGVWHFAESGNGTAGEYKDSTSHNNDGQGGAGVAGETPVRTAIGVAGYGQDYDGNSLTPPSGHDQFISVPDSDGFSYPTQSELRISFFTRMSTTNFYWYEGRDADYLNMLGKGRTTQFEWVFSIGGANSGPKPSKMTFYWHDLVGGLGDGTPLPTKAWSIGDKVYWVGWFSITEAGIRGFYPDGTIVSYHGVPVFAIPSNGTAPLSIGGEWAAVSNPQHFVGGIDELRISNSLRQINSDLGLAWDTASYNSELDKLVVLGDGSMGQQTIEKQTAVDNVTGTCGTAKWGAQTFTPTVTHTIQKVTLKIYRGAAASGNFNVGIRATAAGKPIGANLTTGSIACSALNNSDYTEVDIPILDYQLTAGTMYAIVWSAPNMQAGAVYVRGTNTNPYAGGTWNESTNSGASWSTDSGSDFYFKDWGIELGTPPSVTTTAASSITPSGATLNGNLSNQGSASNVTVSFEYGLTTSYGNTAVGVPPTLNSTGAFTAALTGLTPNTIYHYRAKAVGDGTAYGGDQTFTTLTSPVALAVTTSSLPNGTVGVAYSQTLAATGGTAPYTWTIASGTLPAGLSLSSSGVISGTPTIAGGPTSVTFRVTDSTSATATKSLSITVVYAAWDVNMDGAVNVLDMISVSQHWGETGTAGWIRQDVNADGVINVLDNTIIGQHWTG